MIAPNELMSSLLTCLQIATAVLLFASSLPMREPRRARLAAAGALVIAWSVFTAAVVPLTFVSELPVLLGITFVLALLASVGLTLFLFDTTVWVALFCATAGYTMQNLASGLGSAANHFIGGLEATPLTRVLMMVAPFAVVYAICYRLLISRIDEGGLELMRPQATLPMMIAVILAVISYDVVVKQIFASCELPGFVLMAVRLSHAALCILILILEYELLYSRRLQREVAAISRIMEDEKDQYRLSKETIEAINLKCHDIRHQIRQLGSGPANLDPRVIDEIEREITIYDSSVHTGNDPLDVILTEKGLLCQRRGITLSCIADGSALDFMSASDIYSLMGNALDNAIEAAGALDDADRRSVSVVVRQSGGMAIAHVENYFAGTLRFGEDGLPLTGKEDHVNHGFGMKSMRHIARRYHGALHASVRGDIFHLNVAIPIPQEG